MINKTIDQAIGELSLQHVSDFLSVVTYSCIDYWSSGIFKNKEHYSTARAKVLDHYKGDESMITWEDVLAQILLDGNPLTIIEDDGEVKHEFTLAKLKHGLELWILNPQYHNGDEPWHECDAEAADIIVQFSLFDDIIYG